MPHNIFLSKNSGTSNTVTDQNGKITTNVLNWNAESTDDITKILYELTTNGKSKYAEVSLPTTQLNAITNKQGLSQLDGSIHNRLIKDYSIDLSDLSPNANIKMIKGSGSGSKVAFSQFNNMALSKKNKKYRKKPKYHLVKSKRKKIKTNKRKYLARTKTRKR